MKVNRGVRYAIAMAISLVFMDHAFSADLRVKVVGAPQETGRIGCALYPDSDGFPMNASGKKQSWHPVRNSGATCVFRGLKAGTYAVAVSHDVNGNRRTDTNLLGIPTEAWGVSNGVRPRLRPPSFREASFNVPETGEVEIRITIK